MEVAHNLEYLQGLYDTLVCLRRKWPIQAETMSDHLKFQSYGPTSQAVAGFLHKYASHNHRKSNELLGFEVASFKDFWFSFRKFKSLFFYNNRSIRSSARKVSALPA